MLHERRGIAALAAMLVRKETSGGKGNAQAARGRAQSRQGMRRRLNAEHNPSLFLLFHRKSVFLSHETIPSSGDSHCPRTGTDSLCMPKRSRTGGHLKAAGMLSRIPRPGYLQEFLPGQSRSRASDPQSGAGASLLVI